MPKKPKGEAAAHKGLNIGILLGKSNKGTFYHLISALAEGMLHNGAKKVTVYYMGQELDRSAFPKETQFIDLKTQRIRELPGALRTAIKAETPDIFLSMTYAYNIVSLLAKLMLGKTKTKFVISEHNHMSLKIKDRHADLRYRTMPYMMKMLYPYADGIYTVSEEVMKDLDKGLKISLPKFRLAISNPVSPAKTTKKTPKKKTNASKPKGGPLILSIGRMSHEKNFPLLISAFEKVRSKTPCRLRMFGEGKEQENIAALVKASPASKYIELKPFTTKPRQEMSKADLFVLSSSNEGFGLVLVEAMTLGIPVISTDADGGGPREILETSKYGLLVKNQNVDALADAITKMLKNQKLRHYYSKKSLERAKAYAPDKIAGKMTRFFDTILEAKR